MNASDKGKQLADDWRWLLSTPQGRRIFAELLEYTGVFRAGFFTGDELVFREGARNVGARYLALALEHARDDVAKTLFELG